MNAFNYEYALARACASQRLDSLNARVYSSRQFAR